MVAIPSQFGPGQDRSSSGRDSLRTALEADWCSADCADNRDRKNYTKRVAQPVVGLKRHTHFFVTKILGTSCLLLAVLGAAGCKKSLSKDKAKVILEEKIKADNIALSCLVELPKEWEFTPFGHKNANEVCKKKLKDAGVLAGALGDEVRGELNCQNGRRGDLRLGIVPSSFECTIRFNCGSAEPSVQSVTTEGKRATIRYTKTMSLAQKFKDDWPNSCPLVPDFKKEEVKTAIAIQTDDGAWVLEK